MAIISINEVKTRSSSITTEGTQYTRSFKVITDDQNDGPKEVRQSLGLSVGGGYSNGAGTETDLSSIIDNISCRCVSEDGKHWEVNVSYSPWEDEENTNETNDPLLDDTQYSWGFIQHEKNVDVDADGEAILNSAGQPFSEPQVIDDSRLVLTVTRNESSYNPVTAAAYKDAVNSDSFFGMEPAQAKCANIGGTRQVDASKGIYWEVTYEFHFNADKWNPTKILDAGYMTRTGYFPGGGSSASVEVKPVTLNGKEPTEPQLLNGSGGLLEPGEAPVFMDYDLYKTFPFAVFGLS